ncbi:MAG: AmmeMemoRadiSam system protein B [Nitrospirae bacterium]|nr:AmmeMemoRadiSam system protein B [Nitrospirota bacterium]MBI5694594.1 AmmeMemoRadiSam system protein B [Nitrospirota bacterium]
MPMRQPVAAQFYAGDCKAQIETYLRDFTPPDEPRRVVAGIVPHAGWFFSGETAAKVFATIQAKEMPSTFILLGAVHSPGVWKNSVYYTGRWETPFGPLEVDSAVAARLINQLPELVTGDHRAHANEHSIEVQTPMIKYLFPDARIVPIAVPPGRDAAKLGDAIGKMIHEGWFNAVVIASTDLTHYGDNYAFSPVGNGRHAYEWMVENDKRIIELAMKLKAEEVLTEAASHRNACGAGAMAAAVAAARAMDAGRGHLVQYTTSYDVYPTGEFDMAVGYAGIVF